MPHILPKRPAYSHSSVLPTSFERINQCLDPKPNLVAEFISTKSAHTFSSIRGHMIPKKFKVYSFSYQVKPLNRKIANKP